MLVRAKFICEYAGPYRQASAPYDPRAAIDFDDNKAGTVCLRAVTTEDAEHGRVGENADFWKYTPCGLLALHVDNPSAMAQFTVGRTYYLDIRPVE